MEKQSSSESNFQWTSTSSAQLAQKQVPSDVDQQDAMVLVNIIRNHTRTKFRLSRKDDKFWNDIIRCCDPIDGRIAQLSLYGFDNNKDNPSQSPTLLSRLDKVERLELRDCRSLPISDLPGMKSLKWLNLCILESSHNKSSNFCIPDNRDWYPPNLKTFLIYGYKVNGDPLDALIATSIVMRSPPIELDDVEISARSSRKCDENDIEDILLSDGIGPFVKFEKSGRISELRLSSVVRNAFSQRSMGVDLPSTIGRLDMLRKLYLYNVCSVPKEVAKLAHLRLLRLDTCSTFSGSNIQLPSVLDLQLRTCANQDVLRWVLSCFPSLRSLEILNVDQSSLENIIQALKKRHGTEDCNDSDQPPICFRNSLVKLHLSADIANTVVSGLHKALFGILDNHPNLSKLYIERVLAGNKKEDFIQCCIPLKSLMAIVLERYPRVRGLSIGGPNIITCDNRRWRLGNGSPVESITKAHYPRNHPLCDILLNLNRCGRVLLKPPLCSRIPVSLWSRMLERAQRIPYAGSQQDRVIQEAGALYYLLRNGPAFVMREQFGFEFVKDTTRNLGIGKTRATTRKRKLVGC
uniref:Uncharacterized protein n=1 Tax=Pseudo-nitzschia delicatissima TaxID=44447 RepID=A0A7S0XL40_9STRA|mmetsp:Transcript_1921/g.4497  ORF Transcript_1921/g.4497 Transcript_1921/m.4497 type:complete len:577 (+) Transcript_1921:490-2220(+)